MNTGDITCIKIVENMNTTPKKPTWYNRVYLCYEDVPYDQPNASLFIKGFKCYRYNSFENAVIGCIKDEKESNKINIRSTVIPICKWMPQIFDKYILNWQLRKIYWLGNHTLYVKKGHNIPFKEKEK